MNEKNEIDYSAPAPETKDFILRIDDSEVDLDQVRVKMQDLECERNHYRTQLTTCQEQLRQAREAMFKAIPALDSCDCISTKSFLYEFLYPTK
jgi:hypothetical protein